MFDGDQLKVCNFEGFSYFEFNGNQFDKKEVAGSVNLPDVTYKELNPDSINPEFLYELQEFTNPPNKRRKLYYYKIDVSGGEDGYIHFNYYGDSAQLYIDGEMFDDNYYTSRTWSFAAKALVNKDVSLVVAEYTEDTVVEDVPKEKFGIESIIVSDR